MNPQVGFVNYRSGLLCYRTASTQASQRSASRRRVAPRRAPSPGERERDTTNCPPESSGQCRWSRTGFPYPAEECLRPARSWFCRPASHLPGHTSPVSGGAGNGDRSRKDSPVRYGKARRKARRDRGWSPATGFARELAFRAAVVQGFDRERLTHVDSMLGQNLSSRRDGRFSHQSNAIALKREGFRAEVRTEAREEADARPGWPRLPIRRVNCAVAVTWGGFCVIWWETATFG